MVTEVVEVIPTQHEALEVETVGIQMNTTEEPIEEDLIGEEQGPEVEVEQGREPTEVTQEEEPMTTEITMENTRDHIRMLLLVRFQ